MKKIIPILVMTIVMSCSSNKKAFLKLPSLISEGMVLQQQSDVILWGKTSPGEKVDITTSWGEKKSVKADKSGAWDIQIATPEAGGPYDVAFQTKDTSLLIRDVLIGEVWLCSGQSNMEMPLTGWPPADTILNSAKEIAKANHPEIHLFTVPRKFSVKQETDVKGEWSACSPETAASFSATAYFFGKKLYEELSIPIGLIHSSWGGTPAEAWTNEKYLEDFPAYKSIIDSLPAANAQLEVLSEWMNELESFDIDQSNLEYWSELDLNDNTKYDIATDDSEWLQMELPAFWEYSALPNFDGIVWLRKEFELTAEAAAEKTVLHMGAVDDMDITYVNGQIIGKTMELGKWTLPRVYSIPEGLLKEGKNVIAVCAVDNQGGGGLYGPDDIFLKNGKKTISLNGTWKLMPVAEIFGSKLCFFSEENSYKNRPEVSVSLNQYTPTGLYNGMINPLVPYTIKGAIWYQGETNVGRGYEYRTLFPAMIQSWREVWDQGDFPFYYVQIAPYQYEETEKSPAAELREAQLLTLSQPNTGMVVTADIGNPVNIHPANKTDVGLRLALWALAKDYGFDSLDYSGPVYESMEVDADKIIVYLKHAKGLHWKVDNPLHFEIAGEDQKFFPAKAKIDGETLIVWSEDVFDPVAVRYGWSATAELNLFNDADLPASPFRSDSWKRLSQ